MEYFMILAAGFAAGVICCLVDDRLANRVNGEIHRMTAALLVAVVVTTLMMEFPLRKVDPGLGDMPIYVLGLAAGYALKILHNRRRNGSREDTHHQGGDKP